MCAIRRKGPHPGRRLSAKCAAIWGDQYEDRRRGRIEPPGVATWTGALLTTLVLVLLRRQAISAGATRERVWRNLLIAGQTR